MANDLTIDVDDGEIWRLAAALSGTVSPAEVASALAERGAAAANAAFTNMAILDTETDQIQVIHHSSLDSDITARWGTLSTDVSTPLGEAITRGEPVLLGTPEAIERAFPHMVVDTVAASLAATASLPLRGANGVALGAAGFGWTQPQAFSPNQLRRLDLIARIAAQALERATLLADPAARKTALEHAQARLIQEAFLPAELPYTANLQVAAVYLPASDAAMGGDWYDVFPVDGGTCLVLGDVAGHGARPAAVMAQLRNAVRAYADEDPSPASVLTRVNRMLGRLEPGETATAIVAVWDPDAGTILRSNAGHPPPLRCRPGEFSFLESSTQGVMLGAVPDSQYNNDTKILRPGTTLLFYTDGLVENRGHSIADGMDELKHFVEGLSDLSPRALCDQVLAWRLASRRREDDLCVLAARLT